MAERVAETVAEAAREADALPSPQDDDEADELRRLEQEEQAARKRREEFEESQRRRKQNREQEELKRRQASEGGGRFDELEQRLEAEDRQKRPSQQEAAPVSGASEGASEEPSAGPGADIAAEGTTVAVEATPEAGTSADACCSGSPGPGNAAVAEDEASAETREDAAAETALAAQTAEPEEPELEKGIRIVVRGLDDHPQLIGLTGTLVEKKWKGNWVVDLDDEEGKKRRLRRRWLIHGDYLKRTDVAEMQAWSGEHGRPKMQWFIVGTWNDFVPRRMVWEDERICWTFEVRVGTNGFECFQLWLERDKKKSVHPDTANAGNYVPWELKGPDTDGEGKHWSFGDGTENIRYEVRLFLWQDEGPRSVEWSCLDAPKKKETGDGPSAEGDSKADSGTAPSASATQVRGGRIVGGDIGGVLEEARRFLDGRGASPQSPGGGDSSTTQTTSMPADTADAGGGGAVSSSGVAKPAGTKALAPLRVGDRVSISSNGPYKGREGSVMKVDEDGDPAVKLDTGESKLFYRADVAKVDAAKAPSVAKAPTPLAGRGLGKGQGRGLGDARALGRPGVIGFGSRGAYP